MSKELPEGWSCSPLRDVVCHTLGGDWGKSEEDRDPDSVPVAVVRSTEFRRWESARASGAARRFIRQPSLSKRRLLVDDLVVEVSGGGPNQPVGRVLRVDTSAVASSSLPLVCSNFCRQLRPSPNISASFTEHALAWIYSTGRLEPLQTQTTNLRNLNFESFLDVELPVPPLAEQHRIVAKVHPLLEQVRRVKNRLDHVPVILKRFRQAVLAAAFAGELTESWRRSLAHSTSARDADYREEPTREVPDVPDSWSWRTLRSLVGPNEVFCYGVVQPGENDPSGVPLIRAGDLHDLRAALPSLRRIPQTVDAAFARSRVKGGELLVTVVGANIGTASLVPPEAAGCNIARAVAKIPISHAIPEFVLMWLRSRTASSWMVTDAREVARPTLNLQQLGEIPVPTPPLEEQREIVARVRGLLDFTEAVERRVLRAAELAATLPQAILSKALAGELVPTEAELARAEGRDYETAELLLQRVQEGMAAAQAARPAARRSPGRSGARGLRSAAATRGRG